MKAIVVTKDGSANDAFEFQDLPKPTPKPNEVLIKVSHFGLNYADIMARKGLYNDRPALPCVLGYDVVGEVEAVGEDVKGFVAGLIKGSLHNVFVLPRLKLRQIRRLRFC